MPSTTPTAATILLCTLNGERFLAEQLVSLESQTFKNWKLIASDDGSSDRTKSMGLQVYLGLYRAAEPPERRAYLAGQSCMIGSSEQLAHRRVECLAHAKHTQAMLMHKLEMRIALDEFGPQPMYAETALAYISIME